VNDFHDIHKSEPTNTVNSPKVDQFICSTKIVVVTLLVIPFYF